MVPIVIFALRSRTCQPYDFVSDLTMNGFFLVQLVVPSIGDPQGSLPSYRTKQFVFASDPGLKGYTYIILFDIFVSLQNLLRSIRREIVILLRCLYSKLKIRI